MIAVAVIHSDACASPGSMHKVPQVRHLTAWWPARIYNQTQQEGACGLSQTDCIDANVRDDEG